MAKSKRPEGITEPMTTQEVAAFLGMSDHNVKKMRRTGKGPEFIKNGHRSLWYSRADVEAWQQSRRIKPRGHS